MSGRRHFIRAMLALGTSSIASAATVGLASCSLNTRADALKTAYKPAFRTGVVLDPLFYEHTMEDHPENAERLIAIDKELERRGLWQKLVPVQSRKATEEELLWVHSKGYIDEIAGISEHGGGYFNPYAGDTYLTRSSFEAAKMAAGSAIQLNLAVYDRLVDNGFGLLRPPGHHALKDQAMGFCLFNSDVIAAKALQKYRGVERIAIIDFDVHHGNGTQDLTIDDPGIMAISIHQHPFWPMTGGAEWVGKGDAKGTNINCPFQKGAGDKTYLQVFEEVIAPKLAEFKPQHIMVFAGYDAHWQDHLAQHRVTVDGFNQLLVKIKAVAQDLCGGRICLSLGGGYQLEPLAHSVAGNFEVLLGEPIQVDTIGASAEPEVDYQQQIQALKKQFLG